jgi:4-amino-4-deoxy-L-arabinose transferase-like glycosyltransferase
MQGGLAGVWRWMCEAPTRAALVCGALALALLLPGLGKLDGPIHSDEAFYLSVATDMVDWGTPLPNQGGSPVYQKPPLVFWAARLSMAVFGRNAAAARLPGALSAALVCTLGVLLAAEEVGNWAAPLAGFLLLGSFGVARFGRTLMLDLPLLAVMSAYLLFLRRARLMGLGRGLLGAGVFLGLSLGVKGPIGPILLGAITLPLLWQERQLKLLRRPRFYVGVLLGIGTVLPWYAWMIAHHPAELWNHHVVDQYFSRFESTHGQPRLGLLWGTLLYAAPFWPLSAVGLWRSLRDPALRVRLRLPLIWLAAFAVVFGLPKEHGLHYPLLILTPLAVLAASVVRSSERARLLALGSLCIAIALAIVLGFVAPRLAGPRLPEDARRLLAGRQLAVLMDHPGPLALASGVPNMRELWSDADMAEALDRGDFVVVRDERLPLLSPATMVRMEAVTSWRRLRPYMSLAQLRQAWQSRSPAPLQDSTTLYRARP